MTGKNDIYLDPIVIAIFTNYLVTQNLIGFCISSSNFVLRNFYNFYSLLIKLNIGHLL
jgi:hypothetical protein